ncbi:MAG: DUF2283 domain-containing protein [bacterium]
MKVSYDSQIDAAFIKLSNKKPFGAIEIEEGIIIHATKKNEIVAIEILDASQKFTIEELFKFEIEKPQTI